MQLGGSCHCGHLTVQLETEIKPSGLPVVICGCSFCVKHRPRFTTDPTGHVTIRIKDEAHVSRYRFGLRLSDFLVCRTCGVFIAAAGSDRAMINLDVLQRSPEWTVTPTLFTAYNTEDAATRTARWKKMWTPATLDVG